MIVLFSNFGLTGPYIGQVKAVLARRAPDVPVIDLFADAPAFDIEACATLLAAYAADFNAGDVFWCVVDPGVGTERLPLIVDADGRWFVRPRQRTVRRRSGPRQHPCVVGRSRGGQNASRPASMDVTCSHRSRPCSHAVSRRLAP